MSSIEAIPQPRIDVLVRAADGTKRPLRRTEYRGTVWYGGRPTLTPRAHSRSDVTPSAVSTPFWIPDSLAYLGEGMGSAVVTASVSLQSVQGGAQVVDVGAALHPHAGRGGNAYVLCSFQAMAALPLGLSYQVVVIVDADRVAD